MVKIKHTVKYTMRIATVSGEHEEGVPSENFNRNLPANFDMLPVLARAKATVAFFNATKKPGEEERTLVSIFKTTRSQQWPK